MSAALAIALVIAIVGLGAGTHAAGGSDSYGYVSQADLWLSGQLRIDQRWVDLPPVFDDWSLSPLGYRPGLEPRTIVPTYPPGLPLLMAAAKLVGGSQGPYYVVPLLGALMVILTFLLGRLLFSDSVALGACFLMAVSPAFLFQLMHPMSDIPAAAGWTLALVLAVRGHVLSAGLASSIAVAIRPNLLPLALGVGVIASFSNSPSADAARRGRHALTFTAGVMPAVLGIALLNNHLYGSPLTSGYGPLTTIYHPSNLVPNLERYPSWLLQTQTPFIFAGMLPLLWRPLWPTGSPGERLGVRIGLGLFLTLLVTPYLFYLPFEDWTYVRFLLPAFPVLLVLAVASLGILRTLGARATPFVVPAVIVGIFAFELSTAQARGVFSLRAGEQRYVTVGREVARITPPNAVFLSMQHSGSLRFYAKRLTVRYDLLPRGSLERAIETLRARGFRPYLLLEQWEEPKLRDRFGQTSAVGRLEWMPVKRWPTKVALYDPAMADAANGLSVQAPSHRPD